MPHTESTAILDGMADERPRVTFDCPERIRRAIRFRMAREGTDSISEVIVKALEEHLPRELAEADEAIQEGKPAPTSRRGRKPRR